MDLVDLIITIAILGVGSLLTGGRKFGKKTAPQQTVPTNGTAAEAMDGDESVDDSWVYEFGDSENQETEYIDEECVMREVTEEGDYFTYETIDDSESRNSLEELSPDGKSIFVENHLQEEISDDTTVEDYGFFDLRQAIISQTILQRVNV